MVINLRRHNAMLKDSTKALASQPQWHGEADGSLPLIQAQAYHLALLRVEGKWHSKSMVSGTDIECCSLA